MIGEMVQEYAHLATMSQGSPIVFQIEGSVMTKIEFNNSKVEGKETMTRPPGGTFANSVNVSIVYLPVHSLFKSVARKFPDNVVPESLRLDPYRAYFGETPQL